MQGFERYRWPAIGKAPTFIPRLSQSPMARLTSALPSINCVPLRTNKQTTRRLNNARLLFGGQFDLRRRQSLNRYSSDLVNFHPQLRVDGAASVFPAPDRVPRDAKMRRQIDSGKTLGFPVNLKWMVRLHDNTVTDPVSGCQVTRAINLAGGPKWVTRHDAKNDR